MASQTEGRICLIAVDGSKHSNYALKWYERHIHKSGDKILLAHCVDPRKYMSKEVVSLSADDVEALKKAFSEDETKALEVMEKCKEECNKLGLNDVELLKVVGDPGHGIVQASREKGANLIVTGCRGLGQLRRTILGSVSDYILHHSEVPVFVCRH